MPEPEREPIVRKLADQADQDLAAYFDHEWYGHAANVAALLLLADESKVPA